MKLYTILLLLMCEFGFASPNKTLRVNVNSDGLAPHDPKTSGFANIFYYNLVLGKLLDIQGHLTIKPRLLDKVYWDFSQDSYVLRLRAGLKFHNGRKVDATDLEFSLVRFFLTKGRKDQVAFLNGIKGINKLVPGSKFVSGAVEGIEIVDDRTIKVQVASPNPSFLYGLGEGWISLVPREALESDLLTWRVHPVGAGPYRQVSGENCIEKSGKIPGPDRICFVNSANNADLVMFTDIDKKGSHKKIALDSALGFAGLFFNKDNPLGQNKDFRIAIDAAISKAAFLISDEYSVLNQPLTSNFYARFQKKSHDKI